MKHLSLPFVLLCLGGCAPSVDVPPAPDLQELLDAYEDPNVNVRGEIMSEWGDDIEEVFAALDSTEVFDEILEVIISVQKELDESTDDQGNLVLDGVAFPSPNGAITINHICTGWGDAQTADSENGTIELTMTLEGGSLGPIVWGTADQCRYLSVVSETKSSFDGDVAVHFGDFVPVNESIRKLLITFLITGDLGFDDEHFRINQSIRVAETGRLDILVQLGKKEAFIFFFDGESFAQGINDATGIFGCSLRDRECTNTSGSTFSW